MDRYSETIKVLEEEIRSVEGWIADSNKMLTNLVDEIGDINKRITNEKDTRQKYERILSQKKFKLAELQETIETCKYQFKCQECGKIHEMSAYALAQQAMNVALIFNCDCGNKIDI